MSESVLSFGPFQLDPHARELRVGGVPLHLGSRAFDLLLVLVRARGELVTKDEVLRRVWAGLVVEENNLQVQVSALRKALGADRDLIRTVAGRGYRFTGEIRTPAAFVDARSGPGVVPTEPPARPPTNLSAPVSELIGRDIDLEQAAGLLAANRLVTLIGAGGIGKTRLGREIARHRLPAFDGGVWLAELAPLSDPGLVPATVAAALGLEVAAPSVAAVAAALDAQPRLVVLDNCEHVIAAAARMAEALLGASASLRVLATSREPLRAEGECVYRVPPLELPAELVDDAADLLRAGAVRLFVVRARAADPGFAPDARTMKVIAAVCRRLGGTPLAIELAAARAAALGVDEIAARLDDRFTLLTSGRRTALPRHRTLLATLDWSYDLLPERERAVLRRLAVFPGAFSLSAASAVGVGDGIDAPEVVACVANLVTKSLIAAEPGDALAPYRLVETTRAYALEKLAANGELDEATRRRVEHDRQRGAPAPGPANVARRPFPSAAGR